MKYGFYFTLALTLFIGAFGIARNKLNQPLHLESLRLGMGVDELEDLFGTPSAEGRNHAIYILQDGSELTVTFRENQVSSAKVKFHRTIKIGDPEMRKLTLVQMDADQFEASNPSWF
jgi:hypothetical protein